jgi:hypothetical protein
MRRPACCSWGARTHASRVALPRSSAAIRSATNVASSTSSIINVPPAQVITTTRSPSGTETGTKESDPRARSNNAQPHHRLPGSQSFMGSTRANGTPTSASDRTRISPHAQASPRQGPVNSLLRNESDQIASHMTCVRPTGKCHASMRGPLETPIGKTGLVSMRM